MGRACALFACLQLVVAGTGCSTLLGLGDPVVSSVDASSDGDADATDGGDGPVDEGEPDCGVVGALACNASAQCSGSAMNQCCQYLGPQCAFCLSTVSCSTEGTCNCLP